MADWRGCLLFWLALLTCFSVCAGGQYCQLETGGYSQRTYCSNGCCHDDYNNEICCGDSIVLGLALGCSIGGFLVLLVCICACRHAYYKQKLRTQREVVGRLDITVVRTVQHAGYGYDQPALPEQSQVSSLGRQSDTATPPNQGRSLTPLPRTGTPPNQGGSFNPLFSIAPPPNQGGRSTPLAPTSSSGNQERPPIILHTRGRLPPNLKVGDIVTFPYEGPPPGLRSAPPTSGLHP